MFFGVLKSGEITNVEEDAKPVVAKDKILIRLYTFIQGKKRENEKEDVYIINTKMTLFL